MPRIDGFEVAHRLRRNPQTSNTSIIMLTAKALATDKVLGLTAGADDYIIKPFDPIELLARVKGTLRRAKEMRNLSPLTGLPGNIRIQEEIERMVREESPFAVLYADLDNFKAYNDQKGFVQGDAPDPGDGADPAGRRGRARRGGRVRRPRRGDDFVAVVPPGRRRRRRQARRRDLRPDRSRSSTTPRTCNAATSRWRTARASCSGCRSPGSRSASRPRWCAAFAHYGEAVSVRHRDEAVRQARAEILVRGRPPQDRLSATLVPHQARARHAR